MQMRFPVERVAVPNERQSSPDPASCPTSQVGKQLISSLDGFSNHRRNFRVLGNNGSVSNGWGGRRVIETYHPGHVGRLCTAWVLLVRLETVNTKPLVHAAELNPSDEELRRRQRSRESTDVSAVTLQRGQHDSIRGVPSVSHTCMSDRPAFRPIATLPCSVFQFVY